MAPSLIEMSYGSDSVHSFKSLKEAKNLSFSTYNTREVNPPSSDESETSSSSGEDEKLFSDVQQESGTTTPEIEHRKLSPIRANTKRLWRDIFETARWGRVGNSTGMARESLTDADKLARDWFVAEARSIGCQVRVDSIGNVFAVYPGQNPYLAPIGMGSHMDTQPLGGMFDGILGCLAGLEVLRTVHESGVKPYCSLAAIIWTNEEGSRFNPGCTGSAVWSGSKTIAAGHAQKDEAGVSIKDELSRIGYLGPWYADYRLNPLSAHFELHIEQGSKLEKANKTIGVVNGVQGIRWFRTCVTGVRAHAGATPMAVRADALVATARIIVTLQTLAIKWGGVATVGMLEIDRASSNTIPGEANISIDIRHPTEEGLNAIEAGVRREMSIMTLDNDKLVFSMTLVWESPAAKFCDVALDCIRRAAADEVGESACLEMHSLAGHDSALTARRVPTAMVFVPSKDGLSHAPDEFTSEEDCGSGVQVLLDAVLGYDAALMKHASGYQRGVELNRHRVAQQ